MCVCDSDSVYACVQLSLQQQTLEVQRVNWEGFTRQDSWMSSTVAGPAETTPLLINTTTWNSPYNNSHLHNGKKFWLPVSALALWTAFLIAKSAAQLMQRGGSPAAIGQVSQVVIIMTSPSTESLFENFTMPNCTALRTNTILAKLTFGAQYTNRIGSILE